MANLGHFSLLKTPQDIYVAGTGRMASLSMNELSSSAKGTRVQFHA